MKVLHVIPDLDYCGAGKQLTLLAVNLPRESCEVRVCVLGPDGPFGRPLREAGVPVEALGQRRWFDVAPFLKLRRLLRSFRPDVLHVWKARALRAIAGVVGRPPVVLSAPFPAPPRRKRKTLEVGPWDRWLLRGVERVVVSSPTELEQARLFGIANERLVQAPQAVEIAVPVDSGAPPVGLPAAAGVPRVLCVGPIEPHKGFFDAVWAYDILRYLYPEMHLALAGDGGERDRLVQFTRNIRGEEHVHFLGRRRDVPHLLAWADVVWVPSRTAGGVNVTLEALAAGKAVVASRVPDLSAVITDEQTGLLYLPEDKAGLARQTRLLLDDAELRRRLGDTGRRHVAEHFAVQALVRKWSEIYKAASER